MGDGPELRYLMVARVITERIEAGMYLPQGRLPPEKELAAELGIAYLTVRKAMGILRDRGLVVTIWGSARSSGTAAASPYKRRGDLSGRSAPQAPSSAELRPYGLAILPHCSAPITIPDGG